MDTRLPLLGLQNDSVGQYFAGVDAHKANAAADAERKQQGLSLLINGARTISAIADPGQRAQSFDRFKAVASRLYPDNADTINGLTVDELPTIVDAFTTYEDSLKQDKLKAEIGYVDAGTGYRNAQTQDIGIDNQRDDAKAASGMAVDRAQIGNYGASMANTYDEIRSRRGKDAATGYGQVPSGYMLGPEGASAIPGLPTPAIKRPGEEALAGKGLRYTPEGGVERIPGYVDSDMLKAEAARGAKAEASRQIMGQIDNVMQTVKQAMAQTQEQGFRTGTKGSIAAMFPGTGAYRLYALTDTIKANLGFDRLQQMRDASPTGGALGQITERELAFLQSTLANLDPGQGEEQYRQQLGKVLEHYENWRRAVEQSQAPEGGSGITRLRYDASGNSVP